jgi:hypothetical protein
MYVLLTPGKCELVLHQLTPAADGTFLRQVSRKESDLDFAGQLSNSDSDADEAEDEEEEPNGSYSPLAKSFNHSMLMQATAAAAWSVPPQQQQQQQQLQPAPEPVAEVAWPLLEVEALGGSDIDSSGFSPTADDRTAVVLTEDVGILLPASRWGASPTQDVQQLLPPSRWACPGHLQEQQQVPDDWQRSPLTPAREADLLLSPSCQGGSPGVPSSNLFSADSHVGGLSGSSPTRQEGRKLPSCSGWQTGVPCDDPGRVSGCDSSRADSPVDASPAQRPPPASAVNTTTNPSARPLTRSAGVVPLTADDELALAAAHIIMGNRAASDSGQRWTHTRRSVDYSQIMMQRASAVWNQVHT